MLEEPDKNAVPGSQPVAGRILKDYEASRRATSEQAPNQTPRPDLTFPKKQFVPGSVPIPSQAQTFSRGGSKNVALKPWKPYAFALEHHPTDSGKCNIYHGRLISQVNAMSFDEVDLGGLASLFTSQSGLEKPNISTPTQFFGGDDSHYRPVELGWTGEVYLYWETDNAGFVTLCELRGPSTPDHVPLPLAPGETIGKFYVKIGEVGADYIEQDVSGDVFWYGSFIEVEETSGGGGGGASSGASSGGGFSSGASSGGSDKSTAIVPASWSPTGYTALFVMESPEVRFDDVMEIRAVRSTNVFSMDRRYVEVCDRNTLRVCSACPDRPISVGAKIQGGSVVVTVSDYPANVVLRLTGVRKGFTGMRFPDRREDQFLANEITLNSAYPA